jgi:hypothetical protein
MTIDATKSPTPAWQRTLMIVLLAALIAVAGYYLWKHDIHKAPSAAPPSAPAVVHARAPSSQAPGSKPTVVTSTTIPGGIPISTRDPFTG